MRILQRDLLRKELRGLRGGNKMAELGLERHSATNHKVAEEGAEV